MLLGWCGVVWCLFLIIQSVLLSFSLVITFLILIYFLKMNRHFIKYSQVFYWGKGLVKFKRLNAYNC